MQPSPGLGCTTSCNLISGRRYHKTYQSEHPCNYAISPIYPGNIGEPIFTAGAASAALTSYFDKIGFSAASPTANIKMPYTIYQSSRYRSIQENVIHSCIILRSIRQDIACSSATTKQLKCLGWWRRTSPVHTFSIDRTVMGYLLGTNIIFAVPSGLGFSTM